MKDIIWFLLIGLIAGWLAGRVAKGRGFGFLGNLVVGILGAILGGFVFNLMGLTAYNLIGKLVMSVCGAVLLLFLLAIATRR